MLIYPVNSCQNNLYSPSFGINLQSKKLRFKEDDFYVRIKGYGHHSGWAKKIRETAEAAVNFIREKCNFEGTLNKICTGVTEANQLPLDLDKRQHTGILRTFREGWRHGSGWDNYPLVTKYGKLRNNRYKTYADRLDYTVKNPLKNPFKNIMLTRPVHDKDYGKYINHAAQST